MTASLMIYAVLVGMLLTTAALLLDRPLRERLGSTRKLWITLVFGALLWPVAMSWLTRPTPAPSIEESVAAGLRLPEANAPAGAAAASARVAPIAVSLPEVVPGSPGLDRIATGVAVLTPLLLLTVLLLEVIRLRRARRRWRHDTVDGVPVRISTDFGPAIVGVWRPAIVIPEWALELPAEQRALLLAHESEHLAARDASWLGLGFLAVTFAPWNPALWYLLRRFRLAMEVDCDQRVLRRGFDVEQYANLLLEIGRRASSRSLLAAGFAERRSMLRSRLEVLLTAMTPAPGTLRTRVVAGGLILVAACSIAPGRSSAGQLALLELKPQVADSVVADDKLTDAVRPAKDLPARFLVVPAENSPGSHGDRVCSQYLRDERDGTRLRLEAAIAAPFKPTPTRPTLTVGFYSVTPAGRYGVGKDELLRVGCPAQGPLLPESNGAPSGAITTELKSGYGVTLDSLTRVGGQLHVAYAGTLADTSRDRALEMARLLWGRLGEAVNAIDTVTVRVTLPEAWHPAAAPEMSINAFKWFFYRNQLTVK